jgi:predicted XRE-type DNA-binding protein
MMVLTIDQRDSRHRPDMVERLVERLNAQYVPLRAFERTAGDELQAVMDDAEAAVALLLDVALTGEWSVGLGVGRVRLPLPEQTRAGAGEAFEQARDAVERAKNAPASVAVSGPGAEAGRLEAELQLVAEVNRRRTASSREAGLLIQRGLSQKEAAALLGITQQAVSSRLASGMWQLCHNLAGHAGRALARYSASMDGFE